MSTSHLSPQKSYYFEGKSGQGWKRWGRLGDGETNYLYLLFFGGGWGWGVVFLLGFFRSTSHYLSQFDNSSKDDGHIKKKKKKIGTAYVL